MTHKTKEQAGIELLAAIDAYVDAVMAERDKELHDRREERFLKYKKKKKNDTIHIPEDARGPYAQVLREEYGI